LPTYDPAVVTHIVTDASRLPTLRALGLRTLGEIPEHVPTVTWGWVISGLGRRPGLITRSKSKDMVQGGDEEDEEAETMRMDDVCMHAAFHERFYAGAEQYGVRSKGKGKAQTRVDKGGEAGMGNEAASDFSRISCVFSFRAPRHELNLFPCQRVHARTACSARTPGQVLYRCIGR
jgi:hypothetical protein